MITQKREMILYDSITTDNNPQADAIIMHAVKKMMITYKLFPSREFFTEYKTLCSDIPKNMLDLAVRMNINRQCFKEDLIVLMNEYNTSGEKIVLNEDDVLVYKRLYSSHTTRDKADEIAFCFRKELNTTLSWTGRQLVCEMIRLRKERSKGFLSCSKMKVSGNGKSWYGINILTKDDREECPFAKTVFGTEVFGEAFYYNDHRNRDKMYKYINKK